MPDNSDADALVLSVDPKNLSSYPQTGTTLYDLSGNGLNGSVNNSPIWEQGGYFVFDATDDNINFGNQTELNFTGDMSHEVWFWRNTNATSNLRLTAKGAGGTGTSQNGFSFFGSNTGMNWSLTLDGVRSILGTGITANQWNHIVGTVDKTTNTQKVYLNGVETNSQALVNTGSMVGTNSFYLGMFTGGSLVWDGKIGPARVYGKLLSSSDIKQNYFGGPIVTDGLILSSDASNLVSYENGATTTYSLTGSYSGSLFNGTGFENYNGGVWEFDGTNDHIRYELGALNSVYTNNSITMQSWLKYDFDPEFRNGIFSFYNGQASGFAFGWRWSGGGFVFWDTHIGGVRYNHDIISGAQWNTYKNKWINIATTWEDGGFTSYLNGKQVAQTSVSGQINDFRNENLFIAQQGGYGYFKGNVATLLAYDRALTAEEVAQNYNAQKQKYQL